jgi:excisionase family DNA binding protein
MKGQVMKVRNMQKEMLTRKEAAHYLRVSVQTLNNWAGRKEKFIPYYKVGKESQYKISDLNAFIEKCRIGGK